MRVGLNKKNGMTGISDLHLLKIAIDRYHQAVLGMIQVL